MVERVVNKRVNQPLLRRGPQLYGPEGTASPKNGGAGWRQTPVFLSLLRAFPVPFSLLARVARLGLFRGNRINQFALETAVFTPRLRRRPKRRFQLFLTISLKWRPKRRPVSGIG